MIHAHASGLLQKKPARNRVEVQLRRVRKPEGYRVI